MVVDEYLLLGHAELVPLPNMEKRPSETFYLPMHGVVKPSNNTTKEPPEHNSWASYPRAESPQEQCLK